VVGPLVKQLQEKGHILINGRDVSLDDVSWVRHGDSLAVVIDTRYCPSAVQIAKGAKLLLCESTYLEEHTELAYKHFHLTARQAAELAQEAGAQKLVLTHFSARYQTLRGFEVEAKAVFPNTIVAEDLKVIPFPKN
jgi:ribonuclease Z